MFGYLERARLNSLGNQSVEALIDSGATTTALDARNIRMHVNRQGSRWVHYEFVHRQSGKRVPQHQPVSRIARILTHKGAPSERAVVHNTIQIGSIVRFAETSLINRSNFPQQLLIGRNYLADTALVDSDAQYLQDHCR